MSVLSKQKPATAQIFKPAPARETQEEQSLATQEQENAQNVSESTEGVAHHFSRIPIFAENQAFIQPKLSINTSGDRYEQEADRMAEQVMNLADMPTLSHPNTPRVNNKIQRKCAKCGAEEEEELGLSEISTPNIPQGYPTIQRKCAACAAKEEEEEKEGTLMRKGGNSGGFTASSNLVSQLNITKGNGFPLPEGTRSFMQNAFGTDFQGVRVHTDNQAGAMSQGIQARAFTHGQDIYFNKGEYAPDTKAGKQLLAHELTHTIQQSGSSIKRQEVPEQTEETPQNQPARFIIDDDMSPADGQMTKSAFLDNLNDAVCNTVDQGLQGTPYSSDNCPYIRAAFGRHRNSSAARLEQVIARYEPRTAFAQSAEEIIELMLQRVSVAVNQWKRRGSLADVSEDISGLLSDGGGDSPPENPTNTEGGNESSEPALQFKANAGGAQATQSPQAVMQSLGKGSALDGGTRGRMEGAFGTSFGNVEIHTDSHAANLAGGMNARAFAVGNHIAFGSGEHQPGTLVGDALMAHELAHTIQQGNGFSNDSGSAYSSLEEDADFSAIGAVASLWQGAKKSIKNISENVKPRLTSGLRLQGCKSDKKEPPETAMAHPCPPYNGYDKSKNVESYNCAGLSHRDYKYKQYEDTIKGRQSNECKEGEIKHWLWTYNLHFEDNTGKIIGKPSPDFHTVAGVTGVGGADPKDVYSKNGGRPVYGPGTGPSFKPPDREQSRANDAKEELATDAKGNPIFKVRTEIVETIYCLPCIYKPVN